MTDPAPLSNVDLPFFFEAKHHSLAESLVPVGQALLAQEGMPHDLAYAANVGKAMGATHKLYNHLVPPGKPVDVRTLCLVREMLGYCSGTADSIFAVQGLGSFPIKSAGSKEQIDHYLPQVRSGDMVGGFALTEPNAGSDVASMATHASAGEDGYILNGEKIFISNVGIASFFTVFAVTNPEAGHRGISAFIVPSDAPGLHLEQQALNVEHPIGRLSFDGCKVPHSALLGEPGTGFKLAMTTLDTFRTSVGGAAVGMARRALDEALQHVKSRVQFGKPLAAQQQVQAYLADMATELDAARLLVLRAAHAKDTSNDRCTTQVSMAKMYATESAQRIIDKALQLMGGQGVVLGNPVERLYREIRPLRIYEGTTEIQKVIIARALTRGE